MTPLDIYLCKAVYRAMTMTYVKLMAKSMGEGEEWKFCDGLDNYYFLSPRY